MEINPNEKNTADALEFTTGLVNEGIIRVKKASYNPSQNIINVDILADRIFTARESELIGEGMLRVACANGDFSGYRINCNFDFSSCFTRLENGTESAEEQLLSLWAAYSPQLAPILDRSRIEKQGNEYAVYVPARYELALSKQTTSEFRAMLLEKYNWNAAIRIVPDVNAPDGFDDMPVYRDSGRPAVIKPTKAKKKAAPKMNPLDIIYGKEIRKSELMPMNELNDKSGKVTVKGTIVQKEIFESKRGNIIITIFITDKTNTAAVKLFPDNLMKERTVSLIEKVEKEGAALMVRGRYGYDSYAKDYCIFADDINRVENEKRMDNAEEKRVELHLHTRMSAMDATCGVSEIIELAAKWGQKAIAITDHGVVHSFPEAKKASKGESCPISRNCISTSMLMQYLRRDLHAEERVLPETGASEAAHRTADIAIESIRKCEELHVSSLPVIDASAKDLEKRRTNHIILIAATQPGLKNLYKLVSYSNLDHFYKTPRIPRSLLNIHREGLIIGSACEAGELFRAIVDRKSEEEIEKIASFYDYLEIQPIGNNAFLVREGLAADDDELRAFNKKIVELGEKMGKPVVATGDVHFVEPEDSVFRAVLMSSMGYKDAVIQPPLYFRTTDDMLNEFSYLGSKKAHEVVIENTNKIADMCDVLRPFLDDKQTYSPELPGAADELKNLALTKAHELYGEVLPEIVQKRLDKELNSIIGNGYSSLYMVAQKLVHKSNSDGYLVGSRGSVGSSFVAHMAGITEVNSLPAHYRCPKCKYSEFPDVGDSSRCGIDLPPKNCPNCGTPLHRDGYEIPFETFLGFKGDKTPDIDLNFSGEYQPVAHKFAEVMFGEGHAFRAGTISGVMEKTAYGYVQHYCEENNINISEAEKTRLANGCVGTRKTTGQHPGGIVIVPEDLEIFDFCPIQHPAEKEDAESITLHFDFHALDDKLVKLDILGHDDPTTLRMLQDVTGLDPKKIPLSDEKTMSIFKTDEALGISLKELGCDVGSLGIPEFGTNFVRGMLMDTRPTTMEELVRIAGLSHGTDVWLGNAQDLVRNGTANLMNVICTRDDIMNYLIAHGGEPSLSFKTMESVRKGRGLTPQMEDAMHANGVPQWYIDSCKKIKYMFPRAHAAAYVMMSFRVAYYKVHYPLAFYSVYFTVRADKFDIENCMGGADAVLERLNALKAKPKLETADEDQIIILEIVYEMNLRGIEFLPIDLYKSKATRFVIEDGRIRPPFNTIAGLGDNAAQRLEQGAAEGPFISREDLVKRTKANTAVIEKLDRLGCLESLPESNQISMF